ncbi:MAG: N-6 DNA methylase, partial [Dehalococcoidia bacterium]|nr:N-6 DNA methylase [Dehalococcoidia bacterium]
MLRLGPYGWCGMSYAGISIEGGLFPPDLLDRVAAAEGGIRGQAAREFALPASRRLPDEIQRSFSDARVYWEAFNRRLQRSRESRTTLTREVWATELFELLGFSPPQYQRVSIEAGGATFPISHFTHAGENATPVHIVAIDQGLDERGAANRRTPHALVQEFLNRSESLWGVVTNGAKLRLLRDSARLSKPTYLEFDLQAIIEGNAYGEFVVLYRLLHATRFPRKGVDPHECLLEDYYNQGIEEGGRVREKLRDGVRSALEILGTALVEHPRNEDLRKALREGYLDETGYYRQLLNFVYRMLFLMVTEERKLLFTESNPQLQAIYDRYYSVTSLRDRAERHFAGDAHGDLWERLAQTFRLFREEGAASRLGISPLNGELFRHWACKDIEATFCSNESFLTAMRHLSTFDDGGIRRRVNYAHLDVEEFGSVYESLLDYRPLVVMGDLAGAAPRFELAAGTERKQTGSYYTPPELVRELTESALIPVIAERLAAARTPADKEKALLALRVCDPASGSGHFLLAAARHIARELSRVRTGDEQPAPAAYRTAIRDVVRNCIFAVDKNPLAVDLCKVALWIEGHAAGLPLGFLDHHVKCGDSLVGVSDLSVLAEGIPDGAYKAVTGDDREAATQYRRRNRQERTGQQRLVPGAPEISTAALAQDFAIFGELEEPTPSEVLAKEELYAQLRESGSAWWRMKTACDLWTYAFFAPLQSAGAGGLEPVPTTGNVHAALLGRGIDQWLRGQAIAASQQNSFFHWPLEFPDVFESGGFDVVLGNPPWDQIQPEEVKFFGIHDPSIADLAGARRKAAINKLPTTNPQLGRLWESHRRSIEGLSKFGRASDRFKLTAVGKINKYSVFAETARTICGPLGRVGIIVPSGIATDDTTKVFFADLVDGRSLVSLYDFENRDGVFPGVHRSYKFCLLTLSGTANPSPQAEFAFFLYRAEQLQDAVRRFALAPEDFALFNPNTRTCPVFRTRRDADIAGKMYRRAGVFWREARGKDPEENPWGAKFQQMLNMTSDSGLFRTREQLISEGWHLVGNVFVRDNRRYLPLYEAKLFHQYD